MTEQHVSPPQAGSALTVASLDPTGKVRARWSNRWKAALNLFDITFDGRVSARRAPLGRELA